MGLLFYNTSKIVLFNNMLLFLASLFFKRISPKSTIIFPHNFCLVVIMLDKVISLDYIFFSYSDLTRIISFSDDFGHAKDQGSAVLLRALQSSGL
jgi:hypothetical protein